MTASGTDPMQPTHPMRRDGSVSCDEHGRWECSRHRKAARGGGRCHAPAMKGLDRCRMHAGTPAELAKVQGQAITAWSALSGESDITANAAVLGMLQMSWLRVHLYAGLLRQQVEAAQGGRTDGDAAGRSGGRSGSVGAGEGLIGHTHGAVKDVGIYATGEAVRGLAQLDAAERDRCVRYAKTAHDMGIAEQQVKVAEQQGEMIAAAIRRILDALSLSAEQRAIAPAVVARELREVG